MSSAAIGKRSAGAGSALYHANIQEDSNTRQWSFTAFEWIVRDVHKLRDFVEGPDTVGTTGDFAQESIPDTDEFEILKESPVIGDAKFKLEIAKTPSPEIAEGSDTPVLRIGPQTLSLYVTSLMVDYPHADYEMSTSMFAAIKCQDDRVGERGARAEWAWEFWQIGWVFRQESEVWECLLPPLSTLLENPRIKETDSFVICVQMHSPVGPFFPQQPSAYYVPRDLLDGLEASLDNPNTGDVQFVCLERKDVSSESSQLSSSTSTSDETTKQVSTGSHTVARKRIIYGHADILTRRSEYFATMLRSSFSETAASTLYPGERKIFTIIVEEADFVTIYWMLKFVYANWLLFRQDDDPREAVDGIGAGWSAKGVSPPGTADEWDWKKFPKGVTTESQNSSNVSDAHSATSGGSLPSGRGSGSSRERNIQNPTSTTTLQPVNARSVSSSKSNSASSRPSATQPRRTSSAGGASSLSPPSPARATKPVPVPISPTGTFATPSHYPLSPRQQRQRSHPSATSAGDPHAHPTSPPQPASALSMYQIAHRYAMPGLAALALEHIMSTITPQSCFAVLLATAAWDELHSLVEDYVVEKWDDVSGSGEFERCCQEVAGGEWGPEGGKTLMALFRRLRSPSIA
ncbi:uncharacterized protein FIBRA_07066 [Fibroporia radiculosa]|uniref:BTB domain-containing protein n=1 Tax=Fibroporia radiculosa TaxID=599839 RepID=J4GDC8_9APHY|nr:uncharacterized protein FIBRA_07066 [Fibroporia radiculosa]CCM04873.1 predicted protein [Fibroporia radiculosa]